MERFSFGGPNDTFNQRRQRTWTIGDTLTWTRRPRPADGRRVPPQRVRHQSAGRTGDRVREVRELHDAPARPGDARGTRSSASPTSDSGSTTSACSSRTTGGRSQAHGQRGRPVRVLRLADGSWMAGSATSTSRRSRTPRTRSNAFIVPKNVQRPGSRRSIPPLRPRRGGQQAHAQGSGLEQRRASPRVRVDPRRRRTWVMRGGYGVFFDRPSAAFINTVFSNYPFLRESRGHRAEPRSADRHAFSQQDPSFPFNGYLPNRIVRRAGANGTYEIRDSTQRHTRSRWQLERHRSSHRPAVARQRRRDVRVPGRRPGSQAPYDPAVQRRRAARARRATWRSKCDTSGNKGHKLLEARAFNQGYDLNAPDAGPHLRAVQPGLRRGGQSRMVR